MTHFEVDHSKLGFREFVRVCHPMVFRASLFWPFLRLGLSNWKPQIIPEPISLSKASCLLSDIPDFARGYMGSLVEKLNSLGFAEPRFQCTESTVPTGQQIAAVALHTRHEGGSSMLGSVISCKENEEPQSQDQMISFRKSFKTIATTNGRRRYALMPQLDVSFHPGFSIAELLQQHLLETTSLTDLHYLLDDEDMFRLYDQHIERFFSHMCKRGIYTPVPDVAG